MSKILFILFSFLIILTASCSKDEEELIPNVSVNFRAPLSDPRLTTLNSPGSAVVISGYGVSGLILYRKTDGGYAAYDRCSSVNPIQRCAVTIDNPSLTATDPCSGARFLLEDGSPAKAPATRSLKHYQLSVNGFEISVVN